MAHQEDLACKEIQAEAICNPQLNKKSRSHRLRANFRIWLLAAKSRTQDDPLGGDAWVVLGT